MTDTSSNTGTENEENDTSSATENVLEPPKVVVGLDAIVHAFGNPEVPLHLKIRALSAIVGVGVLICLLLIQLTVGSFWFSQLRANYEDRLWSTVVIPGQYTRVQLHDTIQSSILAQSTNRLHTSNPNPYQEAFFHKDSSPGSVFLMPWENLPTATADYILDTLMRGFYHRLLTDRQNGTTSLFCFTDLKWPYVTVDREAYQSGTTGSTPTFDHITPEGTSTKAKVPYCRTLLDCRRSEEEAENPLYEDDYVYESPTRFHVAEKFRRIHLRPYMPLILLDTEHNSMWAQTPLPVYITWAGNCVNTRPLFDASSSQASSEVTYPYYRDKLRAYLRASGTSEVRQQTKRTLMSIKCDFKGSVVNVLGHSFSVSFSAWGETLEKISQCLIDSPILVDDLRILK